MIPQFDLVAVARPFVDVMADVDDDFLARFGVRKGGLVEISPRELIALQADLAKVVMQPGGSLSNTVAGMAAMGARTAFIGKACNDTAGRIFRNAFLQGGVVYPNQDLPAGADALTGTCLVLITPDGHGTVIYSRGVADHLGENDLFPEIVKSARLVFIEVNLLLMKESARVFRIIEAAREERIPIAFALHATFPSAAQQARFMAEYLEMATVLIGNRREFDAFFPGRDIQSMKDGRTLLVMTDGENGAIVCGEGEYMHLPPHRLGRKPNTVGAGDQFAAGFLLGYLNGLSLDRCMKFGAETADAILESPGARPVGDWRHIAAGHMSGVTGKFDAV